MRDQHWQLLNYHLDHERAVSQLSSFTSTTVSTLRPSTFNVTSLVVACVDIMILIKQHQEPPSHARTNIAFGNLAPINSDNQPAAVHRELPQAQTDQRPLAMDAVNLGPKHIPILS
jgi:hypothetical protein